MKLYAESSALVAWLLNEPRRAGIEKCFSEADDISSSRLTLIEAGRAISRAHAKATLTESQTGQARTMLGDAALRWRIIEITPQIATRAAQTFPSEPVRSPDAIHLATMLEFRAEVDEIQVLSLDLRVRDNARRLGFAVLPQEL